MTKDVKNLLAENTKNQALHKCKVSENDYLRVIPKIELIKHLAEIESSIYAVYDMNKGNYLLQSNEQKRIFGINGSSSERINSETHYNNIHPDDLAFVLETDNLLYSYFSKMDFNDKKNFKLVYDFRTRNIEGFYVRHMHQCIAIEPDKNGKTWLTLVISHLLSNSDNNKKPQRHLINFKTGKLHLFNEIDEPNQNLTITKREKEILSLIGRGYDSINISDKLNISINTVNNHRQNILRKTKTENTNQAVLYYKRLGLI